MALGDGRTADQIKAEGDEMSVQAAYSGGNVPGATFNPAEHTLPSQNMEPAGDSPQDYIDAGYFTEDDLNGEQAMTPDQQLELDHEAAESRYVNALTDQMQGSIADIAHTHQLTDTEALQTGTLARLNAAVQQVMASGVTAEEIEAEFTANPVGIWHQAALMEASEQSLAAAQRVTRGRV